MITRNVDLLLDRNSAFYSHWESSFLKLLFTRQLSNNVNTRLDILVVN